MTLVLLMGATGCANSNQGQIVDVDNNYAIEFNGDKTLMLVDNYKSDYLIVVPEKASEIITIAAQDLQKYIKLSTKCKECHQRKRQFS